MCVKYGQGSSEAHTPRRGRSCHTPREDNVPDDLAVDGARDTVLQLQVHLGYGVLREDGSIRDITYRVVSWLYPATEAERERESAERTDGSRLNHVADGEALDRLVLGRASRAVAAADGLDVAAALLVAAAGKIVSIRLWCSGEQSLRGRRGIEETTGIVRSRRATRRIRRESYLFFLFLTILAVFVEVGCRAGWLQETSKRRGQAPIAMLSRAAGQGSPHRKSRWVRTSPERAPPKRRTLVR